METFHSKMNCRQEERYGDPESFLSVSYVSIWIGAGWGGFRVLRSVDRLRYDVSLVSSGISTRIEGILHSRVEKKRGEGKECGGGKSNQSNDFVSLSSK